MALKPEFSLTITKEDVSLPEADSGKLAFLLHNILTKKECEKLIKEAEKTGFETALLNVRGREVEMTGIRNSCRCVITSPDYASILWQRVKDFVPAVFNGRNVVGLNERLRFLRYDSGQFFKPHVDGCSTGENGEKSFITFQLYLNEGFKGGATSFLDGENDIFPVIPKTGSVLIFQHNICHEGSLLKKGRKYTIRSDVMYEPFKKGT